MEGNRQRVEMQGAAGRPVGVECGRRGDTWPETGSRPGPVGVWARAVGCLCLDWWRRLLHTQVPDDWGSRKGCRELGPTQVILLLGPHGYTHRQSPS